MERIESKESGSLKMTIEEVYRLREEILQHPEDYGQIVTHFSAGGLGACAYSRDISAAVLAHCWEHSEFRTKCPNCDEEAYIYMFAGHVNGGGYWQLKAYCPKCNRHTNRGFGEAIDICQHWRSLMKIEKSCREIIP